MMKTDFASIKKEFTRIATELRGFDFASRLSATQRARLETRYRELKRTLTDLQKRLDENFARVSVFVRKTSGKKVSVTKKTSRKAAGATTTRKKVAKKTSKKTSSKPARAKKA